MTTRDDPTTSEGHIALVDRFSAHNYHPLPVVISSAEGVWVTDVEGKRYLDMLAAYSALNFGHRHPDLVKAAQDQLERLTLTSRAFHNDQLGPFLPRARRAGRQGQGPADEHRRRGRRDGDQERAQVGLQGQGRARRPGEDHRGERQLPRPHDHHRLLQRRPGLARRLRPVHAGVRHGAVRRRRGARGRDRRRRRRRSSSSRSRARPASSSRPRATCAGPRALHRAAAPC